MFSMIDGEGIMPSAQAFWLTDTRKRVIPFRFLGTIRHFTCVKYGSSYVLELVGEIRLGAVELCAFRSVHGQAASVLRVVQYIRTAIDTKIVDHGLEHTQKMWRVLIRCPSFLLYSPFFLVLRLMLESGLWEESSRTFIIFSCLSTWNKLKQFVQIATSRRLVARSSYILLFTKVRDQVEWRFECKCFVKNFKVHPSCLESTEILCILSPFTVLVLHLIYFETVYFCHIWKH